MCLLMCCNEGASEAAVHGTSEKMPYYCRNINSIMLILHSVALFALHVKSTSGARLSPCWEVLRPMLDAVAVQCWGHWMPLSLVQRLQDGNADVVAAGAQERSLKATPRVPSRPYKKHARTTTLLATPSAQQQAHVSQQPLSHAADLPAPPVLTLRVLCDLWKRPDAVPWSITREELHQARLLHQVRFIFLLMSLLTKHHNASRWTTAGWLCTMAPHWPWWTSTGQMNACDWST